MRKLTVYQHITLDGVIQSPGSKEEDPENDFHFGGWCSHHKEEKIGKLVHDTHTTDFDLILGRKVYDIWSNYWPKQDFELAHFINKATKYVITHRSESLSWGPAKALSSNFIDQIRELKNDKGHDLISWGSSTLMPQLLKSDLVDELVLITYPVLVGSGKRLFDQKTGPLELTLKTSLKTDSGVLINTFTKKKESQDV